MKKVISSWSGGKESCLACYRAIKHGYKVEYLLNFISKEYKRCCFHGIEARLINLQSKLIGIPLVQREVSSNMEEYEKEFKEAVFYLKNNGIEGMVFGDVYLEEHKNWVERVCKDLGIQPIEPLWKIAPEKVIEVFINLGFKAVIVSCKADLFDEEFVGRYVDKNLLDELIERRICPCGENGEFHTFVVDGPIFQKRIEITKSQSVLRQGFWKYWFLDILEWRLKRK
jgi:uncharacterized protein (TIGR00290 family)